MRPTRMAAWLTGALMAMLVLGALADQYPPPDQPTSSAAPPGDLAQTLPDLLRRWGLEASASPPPPRGDIQVTPECQAAQADLPDELLRTKRELWGYAEDEGLLPEERDGMEQQRGQGLPHDQVVLDQQRRERLLHEQQRRQKLRQEEDEEQRKQRQRADQEDEERRLGGDSHWARLREWQHKKDEFERMVRDRGAARRISPAEMEENERKLQDYIRRNTPITVGPRQGPEELRRHEEARREEIRRREEARREEARRQNEQVRRAELERRQREEERRRLAEEESRRLQQARHDQRQNPDMQRQYQDTQRQHQGMPRQHQDPQRQHQDPQRHHQDPQRQHQDTMRPESKNWLPPRHQGANTQNPRQEEGDRRYVEFRRNGSQSPAEQQRQEEERLRGLPVQASIIIRPGQADANSSGHNPGAPALSLRQGFGDEIDFPGFSPGKQGPSAGKFPAPVTRRPPVESPPPCVWAIVVCCKEPRNLQRLTRCFEATDCPGGNWDSNRCSRQNVNAANHEIMQFYLKGRVRA